MSKTIQQGQSFFDAVILQQGSYVDIVELAEMNNVSITDSINIGTEIKVVSVTNRRLVSDLQKRSLPATALHPESNNEIQVTEGIGSMEIESTFKVY